MVMLLSVGYGDNDGQSGSEVLYIDDGLTLAQVQEGWDALAPMIDNVIGGIIQRASVTLELTLPGGLSAVPDVNSEIQKGALLSFNTEGRYSSGLYFPTVLQPMFSGNTFNNALAGATLINAIVNGIAVTGGDMVFQNGHDEKLISYRKGTKSFRKS